MAGQQGQPKYGYGWPDGRLGGLGPAGSTTPGYNMQDEEETPNYSKQGHSIHFGLPSRSHIGVTEFSSACMLPVSLRVNQLKLNHMYNIVNGISPHYLRGEVSMAGNHGHNTRSGNRACFVPRVNNFAIK